MKPICLLAAIAVLPLFSCRTHKTITESETTASASYTDTTKTVADAVTRTLTETDTTKTTGAVESRGVIEFVEGGGKVSIDTAGNVTLNGVKSIKGQRQANASQENGIARQAEETAGHREQLNGVAADKQEAAKQTEEKAPAQKWYDTMLARIGLAVCIAALMWLLFLYLKRKF